MDRLVHVDVDEFLICAGDIGAILSALPAETQTGHVRAVEALVPQTGTVGAFETFIPGGPPRRNLVGAIYPTFAPYLKGGFVSHLAGNMFTRTGCSDVGLRIHNAAQGGKTFPNEAALTDITRADCHTNSWTHWLEMVAYRHAKRSYRAEMTAALPPNREE